MARNDTAKRKSASAPASADAWRKANDAGPHTAVLPSGVTVRFVIPDSSALLRAGRIPEKLRTTALYCAAHPDGPEGYMLELIAAGMLNDELAGKTQAAILEALELGHELVAEMLVEPEVTAGEVGRGEFPELDVKMLLEFAERRRNVDADGTKLAITTLSEWAMFRRLDEGTGSARDGETSRDDARGDVPEPHELEV